jgi:hypothetical protein
MTQGLETAVGIALACTVRDDFRWLAGGLSPSDQTLLNFLTDSGAGLASIWEQVLRSMHEAGHIDLSAIAEDGTKLRANASPRSFLTATEISKVIEELTTRIAEKVKQLTDAGEQGHDAKAQAELRTLRQRLSRAEHAARELEARRQRRAERATRAGPTVPSPTAINEPVESEGTQQKPIAKFTRSDFRPDPVRDVLICPANKELPFIGEYPTDNGRSSYRLYGRSGCGGCPLKERCTTNQQGKRRVKVPAGAHATVESETTSPPPMEPCPTSPPIAEGEEQPAAETRAEQPGAMEDKEGRVVEGTHPGGPVASITEPETVMMLATSEKRWEPSYNADLAVTRHGVIVSQFLTKDPTDFHHFDPALRAVLATLGKPESWVGDGHYGTHANILLANREGVLLYAPPAGRATQTGNGTPDASLSLDAPDPPNSTNDGMTGPSGQRFGRHDFRYDAERGAMICPADQELRLIGMYATEKGLGSYRLYGRRDCGDCSLKSRCTEGRGRRLKVPIVGEDGAASPRPAARAGTEAEQDLGRLLHDLADRMEKVGDAVLRFRRQTVEPVNAHLKQHGLGRFHVRGLARCAVVLTLASIAHNLTKWRAREAARSLRAIA